MAAQQNDDVNDKAESASGSPKSPASGVVGAWATIKKHKVVEWAIAYIAFGYATLHGVIMLREAFEWPAIIPRLTVFLLLLGFPVVVTFAWYHGHRARQRISGPELLIVSLLLVIAGSVLWGFSRPREHPSEVASVSQPASAAVTEKSIAVLPFVDLSEKGDQAYFAEGMAEEIAALLSSIPGLHVIGTTSSFRFRDRGTDTRSIASQLGTSYLVHGDVRRSGDRIRVSARLLDGHTGEQRWSETYSRGDKDVLKVQDDIAVSVARALQLTVTADFVSHQSLKTPAAYDLYLKGVRAADLGTSTTRAEREEVIADLEQVLVLDPTYAPAAADLASILLDTGVQGWAPNQPSLQRAQEEAERALHLDSKLGAAHAVMARVYLYGRNWDAARKEILKAQQFGAQLDWRAAETAAALAANTGEWDRAVQMEKAALAVDPFNADLYAALAAMVYVRSNRFTEAEAALRRAIEISPAFPSAYYYLGLTLMLQGRLNDALAAMQQETVENGKWEGLAIVYDAMRRKADADAAIQHAIEIDHDDWPSGIARVHAARGEIDQALHWLDHALSVGDLDLCVIRSDPLLKNLEGDPRYKAFLRKMNLSE